MEAVQFVQLDPSSLKKELLEGILTILSPIITDGLMTQQEVADFYKASKPTIIEWQKKGKIKVYTIPGTTLRRYKKSELMDALILMKTKN